MRLPTPFTQAPPVPIIVAPIISPTFQTTVAPRASATANTDGLAAFLLGVVACAVGVALFADHDQQPRHPR